MSVMFYLRHLDSRLGFTFVVSSFIVCYFNRRHLVYSQVFPIAWITRSSTSFTLLCLILWVSALSIAGAS